MRSTKETGRGSGVGRGSIGPGPGYADVMTRSLVLTQAEEGQDGKNNDDQADEINQSMHALLLNQWPEHKTAPKEESAGTENWGSFGGEYGRHRRWRLHR